MKSASVRSLTFALLAVSAALGVSFETSAASAVIRVHAGDWDRDQSIVVFQLPADLQTARQLRDDGGRLVPLQADSAGQASFILSELPKGAAKSFMVLRDHSAVGHTASSIDVTRTGKKLTVTSGGKSVLEYQAEPSDPPRPDIDPIYKRGGYLHPVLTPSGRLVTDDYPSNHKHHHGIWMPWTKTEFEGRHPDFWNMGDGKGRVEFRALEKTWNGPVHGGFQARHRFVDLTASKPKVALNEGWEIRVFAIQSKLRPYWMFDLTSVQECASASPLTLLKYYYGGLGLRGHWDWNGTNNTFFLTSEGETDRVNGNQTRARWCHMSGTVEGQRAGIALLCHPDNFRAPQPMRLHPSEPFFCFAPAQLGDFQIEPGKAYVSRYRFIVQDGPPDRAELDRLWNDYAHPIQATVDPR